MPYTLKTQQIAVKDPDTGVYSGVDILTEQTTEGLLTEIIATGSEVKTDVAAQMATERSDFNTYVTTKEAELDQYKSTTETNINTYVTNKNQEIATMIAEADEDVSDLEDRKQDVADAVADMLGRGADNTLTTPNVPAESKATGDLFETIVEGKATQPTDKWNRLWIKPSANDYEIPTMDEHNELKSALTQMSESNDPKIFLGSTLSWENKSIGANNGSTSVNSARLKTVNPLPKETKSIIASNLILQMGAFAFQGSTYIGWWNGSSFVKTDLAWTNYRLDLPGTAYDVYIVLKYKNGANITSTEAINITLLNTSENIIDLASPAFIGNPYMRNGTVGNEGNAYGISFDTIESRKEAKGVFVYCSEPLSTGYYYRLTYATYDIDSGINSGGLGTNTHRVTSDTHVVLPVGERLCYIPFNDASIGFSMSLMLYDNTGTVVPLRVDTFGNKKLFYELDYIGNDEIKLLTNKVDVVLQTIPVSWLFNGVYFVDGKFLSNGDRMLTQVPLETDFISFTNGTTYAIATYNKGAFVGAWNGTGFQSAVEWFTNPLFDMTSLRLAYPDYDFILVIALPGKGTITDTTALAATVTFSGKNELKKPQNGFNEKATVPYLSACTIINGILYVFAENTTQTPNDNVDIQYYKYPLTTRGYVPPGSITSVSMLSNFGHNNSVDYNSKNDYLLSSNAGGSSNTNAQKIYLIKNASSVEYFNINGNNATVIDISSDGNFGKQANCFWGDDNFGRNDLIYVLSNYEVGNMSSFLQNNACDYSGETSVRFIHLLQLGKGTNDLGNGDYSAVSANDFNGSYKILKSWTYDFVYNDGINDGQYYKGSIYLNTVAYPSVRIVKLSFDGSSVIKKIIQKEYYDASGTNIASEGEGLCISDDFLYVGNNGMHLFTTDYITSV